MNVVRKISPKILPQSFFARPTVIVARELLGKYLVRKENQKTKAHMITEVEAYTGADDMSSHAAMGPTKRNQAMFGAPGHWYVYLIYGMYHCLNIVTEPDGTPSAVLIRGVASSKRGNPRPGREGISGPGKVCKELNITRALYGQSAARKSGLWIEDRGVDLKGLGYKITQTPRMNIGGDQKAKRQLRRFLLEPISKIIA